MPYIVTWFKDGFHVGWFGPFSTHQEALDFANKHDQYYPIGYLYQICALFGPENVRKHGGQRHGLDNQA